MTNFPSRAAEPLLLTHVTLTGVDVRTDLSALVGLSKGHPLVEWGFLYSPRRQGLPGRYPAVEFLLETFRELPSEVRVALHACGSGVLDLLEAERTALELAELVALRRGRLQLNFNQTDFPLPLSALGEFMLAFPELQVITQYNKDNQHVHKALAEFPLTNHQLLFDSSGGCGLLATEWPRPISGVTCGYAGGLGPDNLSEQLVRIAHAADGRPTWIDMESSLRVKDEEGVDWLSLERCAACLERVPPSLPRSSTDQV